MELAGCQVDWVPTPAAAFRALARRAVDLVVWGVPTGPADGRANIIAELRRHTEVSLLAVDGGLEMAQLDLEAGADAWLPKPFVPGALVGSVRAALRRTTPPLFDITAQIEIYGMVFDGATRRLTFAGRTARFTPLEWTMLHILVSNPNRFLSDPEVLSLGWQTGVRRSERLLRVASRISGKLHSLHSPCRVIARRRQGHCLEVRP